MIGEIDGNIEPDKVCRVLVCSGKVYYDLVHERRERANTDTAIIRLEQLYPFPHKAFGIELEKFPNLTEVVWVQGRAAKPGRMVPDPAQHPGADEIRAKTGVCRTRAQRLAGSWLLLQACCAAKGIAGAGIRAPQGRHFYQITAQTGEV